MLHAAIRNIHNDRLWWRKILLGGALMLTVVGYPWAEGLVIENLDNARKGFPTPLPPWREWFTRYITGLFALLIDFVFFFLPLLVAGLLLFCVAALFLVAGGTSGWLAVVGVAALIYELAMFAIGVAPVGRLIYVEDGYAEDALSIPPLRDRLRPGARRVYARARLQSLPAYLPALLLSVAGRFVPWPFSLFVLWLICSALLYAHLAVVQLYAAAESDVRFG